MEKQEIGEDAATPEESSMAEAIETFVGELTERERFLGHISYEQFEALEKRVAALERARETERQYQLEQSEY